MNRVKGKGLRVKGLFIFVALIFLAAACNHKSTVTINGHTVNIEIAQTQIEREIGLSGRDSLAENSGMLFVFDQPDKYSFWMKDMKFPLDFIWIRDQKVVQITEGVPILPLVSFKPDQLVDNVLEVNSGWVAKNGIKIGDKVELTR